MNSILRPVTAVNKILCFLLFFLFLGSLLSACQGQASKAVQATQTAQGPEPEELTFEVLEKRETGGYDQPYHWLLVITDSGQIDRLQYEVHFDGVVRQKLHQVDYQNHFAAIIYRGKLENSSPGYIPEILKVTQLDNVITIHTHFPAPADVTSSPSSPYTVIQVTRPVQWNSETLVTTRTDWETPEQVIFIP